MLRCICWKVVHIQEWLIHRQYWWQVIYFKVYFMPSSKSWGLECMYIFFHKSSVVIHSRQFSGWEKYLKPFWFCYWGVGQPWNCRVQCLIWRVYYSWSICATMIGIFIVFCIYKRTCSKVENLEKKNHKEESKHNS